MNAMVQAEIPNQLWQQAQNLVQHGWASNLQEVINEALRRYLDSHQEVLAELFIHEDIIIKQSLVVTDAGVLIHLDGLGALDVY